MSFQTGQQAQSSSSSEPLQPCRRFTISEIQIATQNFDESLVIGSGGFGKVYKGTVANEGSLLDVAVKRLEATSNQGAVEFLAEIETLSKLRHCHLVSLIGYCNDGQEMILVYQYMPHGTLAHHLHKLGTPLSWVRRLKICIGAARGLHYLHTGTGINHGVIHRDVKSSNILLDDCWEAKISDFGLSKIGPTNQPCTSVSTLVKGTFGYLDPDYVFTGRLTRKSDVYAFGVVLFEVLCGKQAVDRSLDEEQWSLARWAQDSIKEGMLKQIVDTNLKGRISPKSLKEFARLADWCLQSHVKQRPTMAEVLVGLESVLALQEKSNIMLQPAGMTIFGRKVPKLIFPSNWENSVEGRSLKSLDIYLYTVGGENRILRRFDFDTINVATESFSKLMFRQSVGDMYKGRLQNGQDIAILERSGSFSFSNYECEMNEASALVKLEHKNLVQLLGYCIAGTKVYFLYDIALYANLNDLIHGRAPLDWVEQYKILLGVAHALVYLHKHASIRVMHADVNLHNIFLDERLVPKLSGFWFSRCSKVNEPDCIAVHAICGTCRFMAPEYALHGCLSTKADVFNFGFLVLQVVFWSTSLWRLVEVPHQLGERDWIDSLAAMSPRVGVANLSSISRFIRVALLCIQEDASDRPSMDAVIGMLLNNSSHSIPLPGRPPSLWWTRGFSYNTEYDAGAVEEFEFEPDDYDVEAVEEFKSELIPR
ncbi:G-type lectin S-receptor-like serine/threonine-protein kinase At1g61480 isoform X1 [Cynara cardunculus var. scolymus]|uniref:Protein kinase, ATP binding site-containing protein n=1 Tax=Cynara cardunculus var. scolymus TaxID=59895 RepID=A0A103XMB9_CYNCS|nr:G-type lectin S-receptor-like serine/threonine-protein kinase At1g61480 isoform X1 [Cynara cardunculus var. scolymus]KVH93421.1 Protein kinase, ATP binding site-containing protein [Cynara cardunculus var. scolymus]